jgi:hypothetical protein
VLGQVRRERVQGVLDEGGKLDPKKAGDRAANDAYYDEVVAPGKPDAATLVAHVAKTGMVPEKLGRSWPRASVPSARAPSRGEPPPPALRPLAPAGPSRFSRH